MPLPNKETLDNITSKLGEVIDAIEQHPKWTPPNPPKTLFFTHDFIKRSHSMLQSLDELPSAAKKAETYNDVAGRCQLSELLITDTTGKTAMMTGGDPTQPIDFGTAVKEKMAAVNASFPNALA
ncbi:MAG: hypothetical protein M1824_005670 [Vezdaea acicularis]|nr:MAG: hypothetical protein M1824_005670 [Vezdaea acicularis]